ncbi:hypothetical protein EI94DRAFT_1696257 [Lactarius quietus]|nr:hypothetical protein EI94DRAFT_1696257 [Lactarius quietus]
MGISLPKAQLISLCLETFLYGVFFTLVLITTALMTYNVTEDIRRQRVKVLLLSYAMLAVATMHLIVGWVQGEYAFVDQKGGSATAFYADISDLTSLLRQSCLSIQSVLGDGMIMWRMYIIYGKRFKVIIPTLILVVAYAGIGIAILPVTMKVRPGTNIFQVSKALITAYLSLTMATNVILTGKYFIVSGFSQAYFNELTHDQSCALYTATILAALVGFLSGSFGQYAAVDAIIPIVIRFHVNATHGPRSHSSGAVWHRPGSRPAGGEDPFRLSVLVSKHTNPTHLTGSHSKDDCSSDIDTPTPV